jgi:ribonuclease R
MTASRISQGIVVPRRNQRRSAHERDPYRAREARKYANPIPSREFIIDALRAHAAPLKFDRIAEQLDLTEPEQLDALSRRLSAMERDGQLLCNRRGGYCVVDQSNLVAGRVIGHPDGFGFLKPDDGADDLFLSPREMRALMHGDRAVARVTGVDQRGRREGSVVEILERANRNVVGRLYMEGGVGFVIPDHKRLHHEIVVPQFGLEGAVNGQMVVVEITDQPTSRTPPLGRIAEVLGDHMAPGMEIDVAIRAHNLPLEWPAAVRAQVAPLAAVVPEEAKEGRIDLRRLPLVTIDGEDARDFDDAVYCEPTAKGWRLLVCIADVSAYVHPDSPLDVEALSRGNSVYFPERVIPMLPEALSNGLCSLNPNVDRLCMAAELYVDAKGEVYRSRFFEAVMRSHARLTYTKVAAMLVDGDPALCAEYASLLPHLHNLYQLYQVLLAARQGRGAIDFESNETRIVFNPERKVERIVPVVRNDAHRLIEECMLAANVAAAKLLLRRKMPALYRVHETPPADKLEDLRTFLAEVGLRLGGGEKPSAKDYAALVQSTRERPDAHLIQTVLLRSMAQAVYSPENVGHFGLAYPTYTHFTSPIRRYPDLLVHRAVKHVLRDGKAEDFEYPLPRLQGIGEHCSNTERRADDATRDVIDWLKCEYMLDKVGGEFRGIIAGVNSFGLFVELDEVYVTGLLHITALDHDYFHFDPVGHRLTGERTGRVYRLGDPVWVQVAAVNLDDRKIDFVLGATRSEQSVNVKRRRKEAAPRESDRSDAAPKGRDRRRRKR